MCRRGLGYLSLSPSPRRAGCVYRGGFVNLIPSISSFDSIFNQFSHLISSHFDSINLLLIHLPLHYQLHSRFGIFDLGFYSLSVPTRTNLFFATYSSDLTNQLLTPNQHRSIHNVFHIHNPTTLHNGTLRPRWLQRAGKLRARRLQRTCRGPRTRR